MLILIAGLAARPRGSGEATPPTTSPGSLGDCRLAIRVRSEGLLPRRRRTDAGGDLVSSALATGDGVSSNLGKLSHVPLSLNSGDSPSKISVTAPLTASTTAVSAPCRRPARKTRSWLSDSEAASVTLAPVGGRCLGCAGVPLEGSDDGRVRAEALALGGVVGGDSAGAGGSVSSSLAMTTGTRRASVSGVTVPYAFSKSTWGEMMGTLPNLRPIRHRGQSALCG
mmetsp:Transcript_71579/g.168622  ORF Transcript_71579/g.168622 Transcript_71579/m.168622 type:complete len:225 (-) Transcript_71579:521-1195(-)